jgi:hypothetical protein
MEGAFRRMASAGGLGGGAMLRKILLAVVMLTALLTLSPGGHSPIAYAEGAKCGGGVTASLTPALKGYYDFTLVCIQHDKCYAHFGISKGDCDSAFIANMLAECEHAYPTYNNALSKANKAKRQSCEYVAGQYHIAVVRDGAAAYKKAQEEAATALFNGDYHGMGSVTVTLTDASGDTPTVETLSLPGVTVMDGIVNGSALVVTTEPPLSASATAAARFPIPVAGFTGYFEIDYAFSYSLNGPADLTATVSGTVLDDQGDTITAAGSWSGSN